MRQAAPGLKGAVRRSFPLNVVLRIAENYRAAVRYRLGNIATDSGDVHTHLSLAESVGYIQSVYANYRRLLAEYAGVTSITGRVAELGPGDNAGVALQFLRDGATHVDLVDRFFSRRNPEQQRRVYDALFAAEPALAARFGGCDRSIDTGFPGAEWHYGPTAAGEVFFGTRQGYDAIVSCAVLEHLYDPIAALHAMAGALRSGGVMIHAVDFRDHGMFSPEHHAHKFLEVPTSVYRHMSRASGKPNRVLLPPYREQALRDGLTTTFLVAGLVDVPAFADPLPWDQIPAADRARALAFVRAHRARYAGEFRDYSDADLTLTGIVLIARKA